MTVRTGPRKQLPGSRFLLAGAVFAYGMAFGSMPDVDEIKLPGDYSEHLQDVCFDGSYVWTGETRRNAETKKWRSRLKRRKAPTGF